MNDKETVLVIKKLVKWYQGNSGKSQKNKVKKSKTKKLGNLVTKQ